MKSPITMVPGRAAAAAGLLALAACASAPLAPTAALQAAEQSIATAEQARAAEHAPAELALAREELQAANSAVQRGEMVIALYSAEEARAAADLATARTAAKRATTVNDEMRRSTEALRQEMSRNPGAIR